MPQVLSVPGRCFPVEVVHSLEDHSRDYLQAAIDTAIDIHVEQPEGATRSCNPSPVRKHTCAWRSAG